MSGYVTLLGAEQVQSAAFQMSRAADQMQSAASGFDASVDRLCRSMEDYIIRFEACVEALKELEEKTHG